MRTPAVPNRSHTSPSRCLKAAAGVLLTSALVFPAAHPAFAEAAGTDQPGTAEQPGADVAPLGTTTLSATVTGSLTAPLTDGFNDVATVEVTGDAAATVNASVIDATDAAVGPPQPVMLADDDANGSFTGSVTLDTSALVAGSYTVQVVDSEALEVSTASSLVVGSGVVGTLTVTPAASTVHPYADGYLDTIEATIVGTDETGTELPLTGTMTATVGTRSKSASFEGARGAAIGTLSASGLSLGTATVTATATGPAGGAATSAPVDVVLKTTSVTGAAFTSTIPTVYSVKDGFRDTVSFTLTSTTSTGATVPATGSIRITNSSGRLVKSWTLTNSATRKVTWDGLHAGRVVGGTYRVTASIKGPGGSTIVKSLVVKVSSKKLVTKSVTQAWRWADTVIGDYEPIGDGAECGVYPDGAVGCIGFDAPDGLPAVYSYGQVGVPSVVKENAKWGPASVRVGVDVYYVDGEAQWGYYDEGPGEKWGTMTEGISNLGWHPLLSTTRLLYVDFAVGPYSEVIIDKFRVEYRYTTLA